MKQEAAICLLSVTGKKQHCAAAQPHPLTSLGFSVGKSSTGGMMP